MLRRTLGLACSVITLAASALSAQGDYYNRDAGRPTRIEDATPTPRYELELQLAPIRLEKLATGARRWRLEPKLAYGIAPFTDIELRFPYIIVDSPEPDVPRKSGVGGIALGALHSFGLERKRWPAFALAGEWIAPYGGLSAPIGSYSIKGIATRTFRIARVHANVAYGTYSSKVSVCALPRPINEPAPLECVSNFIPFDPPCDVVGLASDVAALVAQCMTRVAAQEEAPPFDPLRSVGMRWLAAAGIDHAFALSSTLLTADFVAERFAGLFARTDLSAELGVRRQVTPQLVLEIGVTRHFVGLFRANSVSFGAGYGVPTPFIPRQRGDR
ncbi:MAG: hypothetical protein ABI664_07700 [bacterium]